VRRELRTWLRQLHDETGYTTIFVTHDEGEAHELADRVVTMMDGHIAATAT
jgi:sulfate transport system ATP-binding protein